MNEIKAIKDFPGYFVSDTGDIYSNKSGNLIKLKPFLNKNGYLYIALCKQKQVFYKTIHRLVAEAFIINQDDKCDVNHKNGIKTDNSVENLEFCTRSENMKHSYSVLHQTPTWLNKFGKEHSRSKIILQIKGNKIIAEFYGCHEAERKTGINYKNINACCRAKRNINQQ